MERIKKGEIVQVIQGKNRGKTGKVLSVAPEKSSAIVEGVNVYKKHVRPKRQGEKGQLIEVARPIPLSRLLPFCASCGRGVRVGVRIDERDKSKVKYCRKCQRSL